MDNQTLTVEPNAPSAVKYNGPTPSMLAQHKAAKNFRAKINALAKSRKPLVIPIQECSAPAKVPVVVRSPDEIAFGPIIHPGHRSKELAPPKNKRSAAEKIKHIVADHYRIHVSFMDSDERHAIVIRPRHMAMFIVRQVTGLSSPETGRVFGGRNHATVLNAERNIERAVKHEAGAAATVDELIARARSAI